MVFRSLSQVLRGVGAIPAPEPEPGRSIFYAVHDAPVLTQAARPALYPSSAVALAGNTGRILRDNLECDLPLRHDAAHIPHLAAAAAMAGETLEGFACFLFGDKAVLACHKPFYLFAVVTPSAQDRETILFSILRHRIDLSQSGGRLGVLFHDGSNPSLPGPRP